MAQPASAIPIRKPVTSFSDTLTIPALRAKQVDIQIALVDDRDHFGKAWRTETLRSDNQGQFSITLDTLKLADGVYEYQYIVDRDVAHPVADPYADQITKFGGYRGLITVKNGHRATPPFSWDDEMPAGVRLPNNNQIVVYEMPLHWMAVAEASRQVGLGTFEKVVFEHLDDLRSLGINTIELLPAQDAADTLNWGYGTRFFFAPDWDMGQPIDMKFFIKRCHQMGMRVILDVVMNHSRECPLERVAEDWFYLPNDAHGNYEEGDRDSWGGRLFRYATQRAGAFQAREFQYHMAEFWIRNYHIDGFRIDEFKGINNWDFLQGFLERAWAEHNAIFKDRPFLVVAEDSWRRPEITHDDVYNDERLVDSMWNFDFRDEIRRLLNNDMRTNFGEPSRLDRIQNLISGQHVWNDMDHRYRDYGFTDLSKAVNYVTSHDVQAENERRLLNFFLQQILQYQGTTPPPGQSWTKFIRNIVDNIATQAVNIQTAHAQALERVGSAFALMVTSVGIPMFLAGEEFADVHDLDPSTLDLKQSDPVDWTRRELMGHKTLYNRVTDLITMRTQHAALQRNEVNFFYSHPTLNDNFGTRVFAYCRTGGQALGSNDQVVVVANTGGDDFPAFNLPWPWSDVRRLHEYGPPLGAMNPQLSGGTLTLSLRPFQVRVFST